MASVLVLSHSPFDESVCMARVSGTTTGRWRVGSGSPFARLEVPKGGTRHSTCGGAWACVCVHRQRARGCVDGWELLFGMCRYGLAADVDLSKAGNSSYQGVDEQVLVGLADSCGANAGIGVEGTVGSFSSWSGVWGDGVDVSGLSMGGLHGWVVASVAGHCGSEKRCCTHTLYRLVCVRGSERRVRWAAVHVLQHRRQWRDHRGGPVQRGAMDGRL